MSGGFVELPIILLEGNVFNIDNVLAEELALSGEASGQNKGLAGSGHFRH